MPDAPNKHPYQERFLDSFDRAQLRREVAAVRPRHFKRLRKKYATWALGASLALGGIGVPMKILHASDSETAGRAEGEASAGSLDRELTDDLRTAESIAAQVAGGSPEAWPRPRGRRSRW